MTAMDEAQEALGQGEAARRAGRPQEALDAFCRAVALLRAEGEGSGLAHALTRLAQALRDLRRAGEALPLQEEAVHILRHGGDTLSLARALRHLGGILDDQAAHARAMPVYEEMMALYSGMETAPLEMANAVRSLACNAEARGDRSDAVEKWQDALGRYTALDAVFRQDYGLPDNPGVKEAQTRLMALRGEPDPI
ncbi:tetratricopeptide repeat protein [Nitrospirillum iridis]|uniref:Tetratricopeptide (TPR) repeat protein n=1 Tax=Nitrospirillum iridis TaxID=765888 RepID=A0A7X0B531_9PROT|nr:tetratricopeptide repeat protein [Nitrospirillum iridis]MBB6254334.1 tetratricopeptide (TPR) repeat protein [Nitrospirillum iridis]